MCGHFPSGTCSKYYSSLSLLLNTMKMPHLPLLCSSNCLSISIFSFIIYHSPTPFPICKHNYNCFSLKIQISKHFTLIYQNKGTVSPYPYMPAYCSITLLICKKMSICGRIKLYIGYR